MFLYLPFEHSEDRQSQARSVALTASLGDPELQKWAEAAERLLTNLAASPIATAYFDKCRPRRKPSSSNSRTSTSDRQVIVS